MELVKCVGFVYGISDSLAWITHTDLKSSAFPNALKNGQTGAGMGARDCFLTLPAKTAHRPTQVGQRGDPALSPSDLQDFFFFESIPKSPFLCLCGAVFA